MTNDEYGLVYCACINGNTLSTLRELSDVKLYDFLNKLYLDEDMCVHVRLAIMYTATKLIGA